MKKGGATSSKRGGAKNFIFSLLKDNWEESKKVEYIQKENPILSNTEYLTVPISADCHSTATAIDVETIASAFSRIHKSHIVNCILMLPSKSNIKKIFS